MAYIDDYHVLGPYDQKGAGSRQIVIVVDKNGNKRTISYPKWLMEVNLERQLDPDEESVDHINGDYLDNRIENLKLVPRAEHSALDTRRVDPIKMNCVWCNNEVKRTPRMLRSQNKKGKVGPFCSRSCAGKYSYFLKIKLIDKLDPQPYVESEYYKKKNAGLMENELLALSDFLLNACEEK
jgi:hypothetical protein